MKKMENFRFYSHYCHDLDEDNAYSSMNGPVAIKKKKITFSIVCICEKNEEA